MHQHCARTAAKSAAIALLLLGVIGCATRGYESGGAASQQPPQLTATEVELEMPQEQLKLAFLDDSNGTMGLSFGPLIELLRYAASYGAAKAKAQRDFRSLETLREGASSAEVKQRIQALLDASLAEVSWLGSQPSVLVETVRADPEIDQRAATAEADGYLRVQALYAIDSDLEAVRVRLTADLRTRNSGSNLRSGSAARNQQRWQRWQRKQTVSVVMYLAGSLNRGERQAAWLDDNSRLLSESLLLGTQLATRKLGEHLQDIAELPQVGGDERQFVDPTGAVNSDNTPLSVSTEAERTTVHWDAATVTVYIPVQAGA